MTDEYERQEFWFKDNKKDNISILGKDLFKCSDEELKYLDTRDEETKFLDAYHKEVKKFYPTKDKLKF